MLLLSSSRRYARMVVFYSIKISSGCVCACVLWYLGLEPIFSNRTTTENLEHRPGKEWWLVEDQPKIKEQLKTNPKYDFSERELSKLSWTIDFWERLQSKEVEEEWSQPAAAAEPSVQYYYCWMIVAHLVVVVLVLEKLTSVSFWIMVAFYVLWTLFSLLLSMILNSNRPIHLLGTVCLYESRYGNFHSFQLLGIEFISCIVLRVMRSVVGGQQ